MMEKEKYLRYKVFTKLKSKEMIIQVLKKEDEIDTNVDWVKQCWREAQKGDAVAQFYLGSYYEHGLIINRDIEKAIKWYKKSAEQGNQNAKNSLECLLADEEKELGTYSDEIKGYCKNVQAVDTQSQDNLGNGYQFGGGVKENEKEEVKWYKKAAEQGNAHAQNRLGRCYQRGEGVKENKEEAVKWYRKAAEQGNVFAQNNLGYCYQYGEGVKENKEEAVKWYRKAAEQGDRDAQTALEGLIKKGFWSKLFG